MAELTSITKKDYSDAADFLVSEDKLKKNKSTKDFWLERFSYWWDNNPSFSEKIERGWILRDGRKVVGFVGDIPTDFKLFGNIVKAFNGTNWRVFPEYRNQSMSLFFKQMKGSEVFFVTTPSDEPVKLIRALKIPLIPRGQGMQKYHKKSIIITNLEELLDLQLGKNFVGSPLIKKGVILSENILRSRFLGRPMIKLMNFLLKKYQAFHLRSLKTIDSGQVKQIKKADRSFDSLWERTKNKYSTTNVRTSKIINWYLKNKNHEMILFGYFKNGKLAGYALFKTYRHKKICECIDLWTEDEYIIGALVKFTKEYAEKNSYGLLIFPHFNTRIGKHYERMGLFHLDLGERRDYFKLNVGDVSQMNEKNSYFVSLEGDHDLW